MSFTHDLEHTAQNFHATRSRAPPWASVKDCPYCTMGQVHSHSP